MLKKAVKNKNAIRDSFSDRVFGVVNTLLLCALLGVILYPMYFCLVASFSDPYAVVGGEVAFLPKGFTLDAYKFAFEEDPIWRGYANTIYYTFFGTILNLVLTIPCAYFMSKKNLPGHGFLSWYFLIPMYFSGGMIPTYLIVRSYGLVNQPYTMIVLGGISIYNMIVARNYFDNSIPRELYESASIDGAGPLYTFFRIALPLAKPILAVITLFYAVSRWNAYFSAMIYLTDSDMYPLQLVLRNILLQNQNQALGDLASMGLSVQEIEEIEYRKYMSEAMKYAIIWIASLPMLIIYPFVQKHFTKGIMIGAVKG